MIYLKNSTEKQTVYIERPELKEENYITVSNNNNGGGDNGDDLTNYLTNYYTKDESNSLFATKTSLDFVNQNLTKSINEINDKIDNIGGGDTNISTGTNTGVRYDFTLENFDNFQRVAQDMMDGKNVYVKLYDYEERYYLCFFINPEYNEWYGGQIRVFTEEGYRDYDCNENEVTCYDVYYNNDRISNVFNDAKPIYIDKWGDNFNLNKDDFNNIVGNPHRTVLISFQVDGFRMVFNNATTKLRHIYSDIFDDSGHIGYEQWTEGYISAVNYAEKKSYLWEINKDIWYEKYTNDEYINNEQEITPIITEL